MFLLQEFAFIFIWAVLSNMHCSYINQELGSNLRASLVAVGWGLVEKMWSVSIHCDPRRKCSERMLRWLFNSRNPENGSKQKIPVPPGSPREKAFSDWLDHYWLTLALHSDFSALKPHSTSPCCVSLSQLSNHSVLSFSVWWWQLFSRQVVLDSVPPMDCSLPGSSVHGIS